MNSYEHFSTFVHNTANNNTEDESLTVPGVVIIQS